MKVHIKTIVCTTDFSDFSNRAIPFGVALATGVLAGRAAAGVEEAA